MKSEGKFVYMSKALRLSVCFSANIGGTATLTGTAPNLVLKGIVDTYVWFHFSVRDRIMSTNGILPKAFKWFVIELWLERHILYLLCEITNNNDILYLCSIKSGTSAPFTGNYKISKLLRNIKMLLRKINK